MSVHIDILNLLSEKESLFLAFETVTQQMLFLQVDDLEISIEKRAELLEKIEILDQQIQDLCSEKEEFHHALKQEISRDRLSKEAAEIFDASFKVKAIVNRILRNDEPVQMHLASEKERIFNEMEELNKSGESVAGKYHDSIMTGIKPSFNERTNRFI